MTVKTGSAWAGSFVTLDATGALSASTDAAGVLYIDGVANAATVTITGSNPYKWAVTLPALTAGQRVDMYITGTIDSVATAGFVASEQADTALLSDGVTLADDAITAGKFDESTAYPLKSADTGATQVARVGDDGDTLETLSDEIAAIKAETASILEDTGTTIPATLATIDNEIAVIDGIVDAILDDTGTSGVLLSTSALTSIFDDEVIVGSYNFSDLLKIMASALAGKLSGGGTTTLTFRGVDDTSDVIVTTVDANKNRTNVVITV